jgi:hypothetical protein
MAQFYRRRPNNVTVSTALNPKKKKSRDGAKQFESHWKQLRTMCLDEDSQGRLTWLKEQYEKKRRGAMESAQAEVDIATLLMNAGFALSFVKEAETRTADLECYFEHDRLFVEVTVIVPTEPERSKEGVPHHEVKAEEESSDFLQDALVKRMLARINEKSEQLVDYCAPVLLALTIVHQEQTPLSNGRMNSRKMALDLQQLGGVITTALGRVPQLSGVLFTLWNIQPAESRSNIRLSNVYVGDWASDLNGFSQVRCLMLNHKASYPIEPDARIALQHVI